MLHLFSHPCLQDVERGTPVSCSFHFVFLQFSSTALIVQYCCCNLLFLFIAPCSGYNSLCSVFQLKIKESFYVLFFMSASPSRSNHYSLHLRRCFHLVSWVCTAGLSSLPMYYKKMEGRYVTLPIRICLFPRWVTRV